MKGFELQKRGQRKSRDGRGWGASIGQMMIMCLCVSGRGWIREKVEGEVSGAQRSRGHPGAPSALKCSYEGF